MLTSMVMANPCLTVYPSYEVLDWTKVRAALHATCVSFETARRAVYREQKLCKTHDSYGTRDARPSSKFQRFHEILPSTFSRYVYGRSFVVNGDAVVSAFRWWWV